MQKLQTIDYRPLSRNRWTSFFLNLVPYLLLLILTIVGVAYTSLNKHPLVNYWEILAVATGAVCVLSGWPHAPTRNDRVRLVWTQVLHWAAFLVAMNSRARLRCATTLEFGCNRARDPCPARARHLCGRGPYPVLADLRAGRPHGAVRAGHRMDRGIGADHPSGRDCPCRARRPFLVVRAPSERGHRDKKRLALGYGHMTLSVPVLLGCYSAGRFGGVRAAVALRPILAELGMQALFGRRIARRAMD